MKKLFIANFKMNKTTSQIRNYINEFNDLIEKCSSEVYLFFPFTSFHLKSNLNKKVGLGAQNVSEEEEGNLTGEISAKMLKDENVDLVLVGHSERRKLFHENNESINKKIKNCLKYGMKVVLCVGETKTKRNIKKTKQVLTTQIEEALSGIYENELKNIIIAYEPVWAIGTGNVATVSDIYGATKIIREIIIAHYSKKAGENQKIVYGGSINSQNSKQILKINEICGLLVGGASLNPKEFAKIIK